ncbi:FtsK/SpoIIIE domain-containing protein [Agromyces sp. NPDC057679]|uniref:FtsK/SpoIIIE domain-containing protein n=1 Tax=Agromyces sp. NPDC057679 TaxID=3346207 RepID=UPI00366FC6B2
MNIAPHVAGLGAVGGIVAQWYGFPGFAVAFIAFIVAAHLASPPQLTGGRTKNDPPTPGNPVEQKQLNSYRMWSSLKWSMLIPSETWMPFWPGRRQQPVSWMANSKIPVLQKLSAHTISQVEHQFLFYAALGLAVIAAAFPTNGVEDLVVTGRVANAIASYILVMQVSAAVRQNAAEGDIAPATGYDAIYDSFVTAQGRARAIGAVIGAAAAAFVASLAFSIVSTRFTWWLDIYPVQLWQVNIAVAVTAAALILHAAFRGPVLQEWRDRVQARAEWDPRWKAAELKLTEPPRLIAHKQVADDVTVDTFEAAVSGGAAAGIMQMVPQLTLLIGSGKKIAILEEPDVDANGQPIPGSMHPTRFRIVTWLTGELPDLSTDELPSELVELAFASAVTWAVSDDQKMGRAVLLQAESIAAGVAEDGDQPLWEGSDEDDDIDTLDAPADTVSGAPAEPTPGAWRTSWAFPDGASLGYLDMASGGIGAYLGVEVIVDAEANTVYLGALTSGAPDFTVDGLENRFVELSVLARWDIRWNDILKMGARKPSPQYNVYSEAKLPILPSGRLVTVKCQPMVIPQGVSILEYIQPPRPFEPQLSTTLSAAPFTSITGVSGWGGVRAGERHQQAIAVYWSSETIPTTPDSIMPAEMDNKAAGWVLAGLINRAFDSCKLARPEMISATPMSDRRSRGHMWKVQLKLYGGVTIEEVRQKAQKIRQALQSQFLRVAEAGDGIITIVTGSNPNITGFKYAEARGRGNRMTHEDYVTSLDWEQAFLVAKVIGDGGVVPKLTATDVLPSNESVQVLDFEMPPGVTPGQIKAASQTLMTATDNQYVDVRSHPDGAKHVRMLVSKQHPLPEFAAVDWDAVDAADGEIPFATGVEGEPVAFSPKKLAHVLVAGASGAGKSVNLQVLLYGAAVQDTEIYVVDPTKGGADFGFVEPYSKAFASTVEEAAALMKHVYAEVMRRKELNKKHNAGSYRDLPEDIRPKHIYLMMDEFTSLMQPDPVSKTVSEDPVVEAERQAQIRGNQAKAYIGTMTGKVAREARSAGVTLILATQKLTAKMLDSIPGAGDLKTNLSRMLLGNATNGDRASALKNWTDAPTLGDHIPKGRGLYEGDGIAEIIQSWFEPSQATYSAKLAERRAPLEKSERVDLHSLIPKPEVTGEFVVADDDGAPAARPAPSRPTKAEPVVEDLGSFEVDFSSFLDELDEEEGDDVDDIFGLNEAAEATEAVPVRSNDHPTKVVFLDVDGAVAPLKSAGDAAWGDWRMIEVPGMGAVSVSDRMLATIGAMDAKIVWLTDWEDYANDTFSELLGRGRLPVLGRRASRHGWWKLDAIADYLDQHPDVERAVWIDDKLRDESPLGLTWEEVSEELFEIAEVEVMLAGTRIETGLTVEEADFIDGWLGEDEAEFDEDDGPSFDMSAFEGLDDDDLVSSPAVLEPELIPVDDFGPDSAPAQQRRVVNRDIPSDF